MDSSANTKAHYKYRSQLLSLPTSNVIKVLMIGNNPREMGCLSDHLRGYTWKKFNVSATFDLKHGMQLAQSQKPHYILLDYELGKRQLTDWVKNLRRQRNFKNTALAVLKDDNKSEILVPGVQDYLLKDAIESDTFALNVLNAIRIRLQELSDKVRMAVTPTGKMAWLPWNLRSRAAAIS